MHMTDHFFLIENFKNPNPLNIFSLFDPNFLSGISINPVVKCDIGLQCSEDILPLMCDLQGFLAFSLYQNICSEIDFKNRVVKS